MRYRVEWAPIAIRDLDAILKYVAERDGVEAAARIYSVISSKVAKLSAYPKRCRVVPELRNVGVTVYRELVVSPYRVFFRIDGAIVGIVGVLDGRRDVEEILTLRGMKL